MSHPTDRLLGSTPEIVTLREQILHLAAFDRPGSPHVPTILLLGETGTGKGLVARAIHDSGARVRGPFVDVNCAAIPDTMLEAELFGYEAGAFTDARRPKPGLFEAAAGGTLFLDEVDALPMALQGKLLKAIEEKRIRRLGALTAHAVDVRLIAATQSDLRELVAARSFRADLFHRLAVVILDLPPLRARGDDVVALAVHFLTAHAAAHGLEPRRLTDDARSWLVAQDWPGNVRELAHLMERATLLSPVSEIDRVMLERLRVPLGARSAPSAEAAAPAGGAEVTRIRDALRRAGGNVVRAAQLLGMGRNALRGRMRRLGIARPTLEEMAVGAPAGPPAAAPAVAAPAAIAETSWEQKPVSVLALEVVLPATGHEPWTLAHRWQRTVEETVAGFGGVFVSRSPSRQTAVFGVPRAVEQLPQRAVQAALAVRRLADGTVPGERPELRLALHVGTVRLDLGAADPVATILAIGDTLGLPERLLGHAGAGEILASAPFTRRIEGTCELRARELRVGEADTMRATVVVGQRIRPADVVLPGETRFVGRSVELGALLEAFDSARAGAGRLVVLVGEAGIGKSRLLAEFRQRLAEIQHRWVEGRCASYGSAAAFHPVVESIRRDLGIDDRDDAASAGAKVERGVREAGEDLAWTLPFVRQLLALDPGDAAVAAMDSATRRSETFGALKAITLRLAERAPLVLVMEDLHWIDPASEEYLAFVADALPAAHALLVCSYRPGYRHPFGDRTWHTRVSLRALSTAETAALTGAVLGTVELPEPVRALIAAKAEGNPFFVEEVTRHLLEEGALRCENGTVVLARDVAEIAVPDTIQDVLVARIDRLADDARRAIQVASVIGREFAFRLLERLTDAGTRVRTQVDELRALELIYEKTAHPELAFMFKHALTHDVAYGSVLAERRTALHRTIGLAIEELYADRLAELYETLAHHFERAGEWEKACAYHERASEKAAETFANGAVVAHCRRALAIADRLGILVPEARRCVLESRLALAAFYLSDFREAGDAFMRAAERSAGTAERGVYLGYAALGYFWAHRYDEGARAAEAAVRLGREGHAPVAEAFGRSQLAFQRAVCLGDVAGGEREAPEVLRLAAGGDEGAVALIRFNLAQAAEWRGDYRRSIEISEDVIAAGRRLRLAHLVVWPAWFLGKAYGCLGDYGRALARLVEAYEVCDRIGDRVWKSRLLNTIGWCYAEIGSPVRAREHNERAAVLARDIGDPEIVANAEINLAGNWLVLGDAGRARAYLDPIREQIATSTDPWMRWRYTLHAEETAGRLALAGRRPEDALAAAEVEIAGARRHEAQKIEARGLLLRGESLLALERPDDAEAALVEAVAVADRIGYPRAAWGALGMLGVVRARAGDRDGAARHGARRRLLVEGAARSLDDLELRRDLAALAG